MNTCSAVRISSIVSHLQIKWQIQTSHMKHDTIRCKEIYSHEDVPKIVDDQREQSKREECNRNLDEGDGK